MTTFAPALRGRPAARAGRHLLARLAAAAATAAAVATGAAPAHAQNPSFTATLLVQPDPSPFLSDWKRDPQIAVLTIIYTGRTAQQFRVEAYAQSPQRGVIGKIISPPYSFPFGPTNLFITAGDVDTWTTETSNRQYVNLAERTGMIPEGPLQLCARLLTLQGVRLTQTCSGTQFTLPEPPQLMLPGNGSQVTACSPSSSGRRSSSHPTSA